MVMLQIILCLGLMSQIFALEVVKPEYKDKIHLRIIRAEPDSFETYTLLNHNGREMTLVCANNRVFDNNPKPMIRYRNFFGEEAGDFQLESDQVCREMGKFIESASFGIDERRPFLITLSTRHLNVEKIEYPNIDPYSDEGNINDLLPKRRVFIKSREKIEKAKLPLLH
jgi:hypothetical protein